AHPLAHRLGRGPEKTGRGLDAFLLSQTNHPQSKIPGIFTLSHNSIIWNRTHRTRFPPFFWLVENGKFAKPVCPFCFGLKEARAPFATLTSLWPPLISV